MAEFRFRNYINMFKRRGIRYVLTHFFDNHLFDIIHGTDTHNWLPKKDYKFIKKTVGEEHTMKNFEQGNIYMTSFSSSAKKTVSYLFKKFSLDPKNSVLIDVGSGKGKVIILWNKLFKNNSPLLVGIEYSHELHDICEKNLKKLSVTNYLLFNQDIKEVDFNFNKEINIFYLYDPFKADMLKSFISKIKLLNCFVIYIHPVHNSLFFDENFLLIHRQDNSWHPSQNFMIFSNLKSSQYNKNSF